MSSLWARLIQIASRNWLGPVLIAIFATVAVSAALDPAGDYPSSFEGPGLTIDEIFNVDLGARLADRLLTGDLGGAIRTGQTLPDHPPLGRLWLGLFHEATLIISPPRGEHAPVVIAAARCGSAVAFGLLVGLIGMVAAKRYGTAAGWGAAAGLVLMPRVFGHAHIAALETVLNLTYLAAILSVVQSWEQEKAPRLKTAALCGIWLGLALLTKIQAIFLPIPVAIWAMVNWRHRALVPLLVWGLVGLLVFFCGWPWLWLDPMGNLLKYVGHASERSSIQVWYWGQTWADKAVPWHYPWVLFATTVPAGLHVLGIWGAATISRSVPTDDQRPKISAEWLLLASLLFPLLVFSLPGIAVYDGERLFLIVFPIWALFIGRGFAELGQVLRRHCPAWSSPSVLVPGLLTTLLAAQSIGLWQLAPCWLSYYNAITGGLSGADQLGLPVTYWGDSVTRELLVRAASSVPPDSVIAVEPVLHQFQMAALESQCPAIRQRGLKLVPLDQSAPPEFVLIFQRREYLPAGWQLGPPSYRPVFTIQRQGVTLAGLYHREPAAKPAP